MSEVAGGLTLHGKDNFSLTESGTPTKGTEMKIHKPDETG